MSTLAPNIILEVCVGSVADVKAAIAAGADRLELCAGLEIGGLTPSIGLVETVVAMSTVPVIAMLRPRAGGFHYDHAEFEAMLRDADQFLAAGAAGLAFGVLDHLGRIDEVRTKEIVERAGSRQSVFHRAFDFAADQFAALETLAGMRVTRILTSGGQPSALAGAARLAELAAHAAGRVELLAGGGINAGNVAEVIATSGVRQVHVGASGPAEDHSLSADAPINLCDQRFFQGVAYRAVVEQNVVETAAALRGVG
ncbi:MAG: copper homeostasis protein CutC [Pirellula sp.]|nr:copper homeostasis protein CutC [Pirellula sp.]